MASEDEETCSISNTDTNVLSINQSSASSWAVLNIFSGGAVSFNVKTISTQIKQKPNSVLAAIPDLTLESQVIPSWPEKKQHITRLIITEESKWRSQSRT